MLGTKINLNPTFPKLSCSRQWKRLRGDPLEPPPKYHTHVCQFEFQPFLCPDVHCDVVISSRVNFKEPEAVRALTCTLLKEDFDLTIQIPLERLIPTVPLRLNYIHWVEDLIEGQKQPRRGIDIGNAVLLIGLLLK